MAASKEVAALVSDFTGRYADLIHEEEAQRLPALAERMTGTLQRYVPGTTVKLSWDTPKVSVSAPQTKVRLNDGFEGEIEGKGHGLQRLFIVSMLQVVATVRAEASAGPTENQAASPNYILAVEEPELYQHPMQARKFARILLALAGDELTSPLQVIYSTHSAHFVGVDRFDSVRLVRKVSQPQPLPSATVVRETKLDDVARKVNEAFGREEYSLDRFRATLTSVMTSTVNEMFFADTVVLVEGLEDQAIIEAGLRAANIDVEERGMAVIPVDGKGNLHRPYIICREFGIAVYLVFDGDANHPDNAKRDANVALQKLCGEQNPQDFPQTLVTQGYACFQQTFAKAIANEFGAERFIEVRDEVAAEFGWNTDRGKAAKNPTVVRVVIDRLYAEGKRSETLDSLIQTIGGLAVASRLGK